MDRDFLSWRGHRVYVSAQGQGDPLLLVTGLGGNTEMWVPFMQGFTNRRVIRFDVPGTGQSSVPLHPLSVASVADLAAHVLDSFDVPWADVVGFSYGGAVAQQFAFAHQARVRRLVLAATSCGLGAVPGEFGAMASLLTPLRYYSPTYFARTAAASYGGATGRDAAIRSHMMAARSRNPPSPYGYSMQVLGTVGWSSLAFLDQIPHETLVIIGDDDPLIPLANAEVLSQKIPRARLEVVERAGHLFLWDEAERLADRVGQFVNAVVQPSSDGEGPLPATPPAPAPTKRRAGLAARRALGPMLPA